MEPFGIYVADEVLDDLLVRLRHTRWPEQVPGIGWGQCTELDWLRHRVSYWADEFDWHAWERRLNALNHFIWEGIHFVYQRAASGRGVPLILTHGWPSSFLDYVGMLPMLENFDVVVPSLPGMRDYWDNRWHPVDRAYVDTPTAFGVFAHQTVPGVSHRARIWSACTTSSVGQSFHAACTSPRLRNQRRCGGSEHFLP